MTRAYEYDDFAKMHVAEERALVATSPKPKPTAYRRPKRNMNSKKKKRKKKVPEYRYIPDVGYVLEKDSSDDEACGDSGMTNAQQQYKMPATSTLDLFRKVNGTYILHNMRKTIYANTSDYFMMATGANVSGVTVTARARRKGRSSRGSSRSPTSSSSSQSPEWKGQKKSLSPSEKISAEYKLQIQARVELKKRRQKEMAKERKSTYHGRILHSHESKLTNTQNCLASQRHVAKQQDNSGEDGSQNSKFYVPPFATDYELLFKSLNQAVRYGDISLSDSIGASKMLLAKDKTTIGALNKLGLHIDDCQFR